MNPGLTTFVVGRCPKVAQAFLPAQVIGGSLSRRSPAFRRKLFRGFSPVYQPGCSVLGPEGPCLLPAKGSVDLPAQRRMSLIRKSRNQEIHEQIEPLPAFLISRLACAGNTSTLPKAGTPRGKASRKKIWSEKPAFDKAYDKARDKVGTPWSETRNSSSRTRTRTRTKSPWSETPWPLAPSLRLGGTPSPHLCPASPDPLKPTLKPLLKRFHLLHPLTPPIRVMRGSHSSCSTKLATKLCPA